MNSYLNLHFDVVHGALGNKYADGSVNNGLINLGPIALFSNSKLTINSSKHLKDINHAHIVSLMFILKTNARGSDDLPIGFDRDRNRKQRELTNNKN